MSFEFYASWKHNPWHLTADFLIPFNFSFVLFFFPAPAHLYWVQYKILLYISQQQSVTVARIHLNFELMVRLPTLESSAPLGWVYRRDWSVCTWWELNLLLLALDIRVDLLTEPLKKVSWKHSGKWTKGWLLEGGREGGNFLYLSGSSWIRALLFEFKQSDFCALLMSLSYPNISPFPRFGPITIAPFMMTRDKTGPSCLSPKRLLWSSINR